METQTKNEIFVKYWSLYLHNTDCYAVRLNTTENPLFSYLKYEKIKRKAQITYKFIFYKNVDVIQKSKSLWTTLCFTNQY